MAGAANAQDLSRIVLNNRGSEAIFVTAYDATCRRSVFRGRLGRGNSVVVKVCPNNRGRGELVVVDVHGRELRYSNLRKGSRVNVRFPRVSRR